MRSICRGAKLKANDQLAHAQSWPKRRQAWPGGTRWLRFPRPTAATPPRTRGRYAASVRAPSAGDEEHHAAGAAAVGLIANVLKGYRIEGGT
jgi:hypothetical protein